MNNIIKSSEYNSWLKELKSKLKQSQIKASIKVNTVLIEFYWELGSEIVEKQKNSTWGSGFLKQLSLDLMAEFPSMQGFSYRNLRLIKQWYLFYSNWQQVVANLKNEIAKQVVSQLIQIPWGHNIHIVTKCKEIDEALFYVNKTIENGWSRSVLVHQIESKLYERSGKAISNFETTLPKEQSDLANELLKDPYNFEFLTLSENFKEKELESGLLEHITSFLLELGSGFAFVGKQKNLKVGQKDFYIDLLFYHIRMHCYVVVELKTVDFEPEFAGKLNFYIKAVDEQIKTKEDKPTIGILLCKSKDKVVVEYSLSDIHKPMGISQYQLTHIVPEELKGSLPAIEDIEAELNRKG
jgi:predicted nuclease of restriction endonuclease-like (RecB) superfamily